MDVSLRVTIQQRDYGLRVKAGAEASTQALVNALNARIGDFRKAFPMQPELTAVVMTALALAEELEQARAQLLDATAQREDAGAEAVAPYADALADLSDTLEAALYGPDDEDAGDDGDDGPEA